MACSIKITSVIGRRLPSQVAPYSIIVSGTASECAAVEVGVTCTTSFKSDPIPVDAAGNWSIELKNIASLNCACQNSISVVVSCAGVDNCVAETSIPLQCIVDTECPYVDDISAIVNVPTDPPCVEETRLVKVSLTATGKLSGGTFTWYFPGEPPKDVVNSPTIEHDFEFPGTHTVTVIYKPTKAGCPQTSKSVGLSVPLCGEKPGPDVTTKPGDISKITPPVVIDVDGSQRDDDGEKKKDDEHGAGGELGCDVLLVAGVAAALAGGLAIVGGVCGHVPVLTIIGIALAGLGILLLLLWWALCAKITSCEVMRTVHCVLFVAVFVVPVAEAIVAAIMGAAGAFNLTQPSSAPTVEGTAQKADLWCIAAMAAYWGSVGSLYAWVGYAMSIAGCPKRCG